MPFEADSQVLQRVCTAPAQSTKRRCAASTSRASAAAARLRAQPDQEDSRTTGALSASRCCARYLNTSESTVQKWEAGTKRPSGMALKLLASCRKSTAPASFLVRGSKSFQDLAWTFRFSHDAESTFWSLLTQLAGSRLVAFELCSRRNAVQPARRTLDRHFGVFRHR